MWNDIERVKMHFRYCVGIMGALLIGAVSLRVTEVKGLGDLLANAATMTSLVLGVVAIFYSFVSNDSLSRSLGSITTVSDEIRASRDQIGRFVELTASASDQSKADSAAMREASASVDQSLGELQLTLKAIDKRSEVLQASVEGLGPRIDQGLANFSKANGEKPSGSLVGQKAPTVSDDAVRGLLNRSALSNDLLMYACVLAKTSGKELSLAALQEAIDIGIVQSMSGFLACMQALGIVKRDILENKPRVYKVTSVHPVLDSEARSYFSDYVTSTYADDSAERDLWLKRLSAVDRLFADGDLS